MFLHSSVDCKSDFFCDESLDLLKKKGSIENNSQEIILRAAPYEYFVWNFLNNIVAVSNFAQFDFIHGLPLRRTPSVLLLLETKAVHDFQWFCTNTISHPRRKVEARTFGTFRNLLVLAFLFLVSSLEHYSNSSFFLFFPCCTLCSYIILYSITYLHQWHYGFQLELDAIWSHYSNSYPYHVSSIKDTK